MKKCTTAELAVVSLNSASTNNNINETAKDTYKASLGIRTDKNINTVEASIINKVTSEDKPETIKNR